MSKIKASACRLCNSLEFSAIIKKEDFNIVKCMVCGAIFTDPQPSDEELERIYNQDYYKPWDLDNEGSVKKIKIETFNKRLVEIKKHVSGGRVLDIGCATGFFLEAAQQKGFDSFGVELSKFSSQEAKKKFGDNVFCGTVEDSPFENNFFDVITMFDLLEHVRDPIATLQYCKKILKPGGLIAAVLPDPSSFSAKLMADNWTHYKKEHLFYFTPKTITELFQNISFKIFSIYPATKVMNLDYLYHQFNQYQHPIAFPAMSFFHKRLPRFFNSLSFTITMGEMFVVAGKKNL